jgi:hypothetical protein
MQQATLILVALLAFAAAGCSRTDKAGTPQAERCNGDLAATDQAEIRAVLPTDSGMHGVWDPHAFKGICTFDAWQKRFVENRDIEVSIRAGAFVPVYVHSDGSPLIHVRVARDGQRAALASSEEQHVEQASQEYLFVSQGLLAVGGIEYVGGMAPPSARMMPLASGRWSVQVFALNAPRQPDGKVSPDMADFVILVNPEASPTPRYRESVETFR